eukprot:1273217-Alexandrium_andersonii.AAC.1
MMSALPCFRVLSRSAIPGLTAGPLGLFASTFARQSRSYFQRFCGKQLPFESHERLGAQRLAARRIVAEAVREVQHDPPGQRHVPGLRHLQPACGAGGGPGGERWRRRPVRRGRGRAGQRGLGGQLRGAA